MGISPRCWTTAKLSRVESERVQKASLVLQALVHRFTLELFKSIVSSWGQVYLSMGGLRGHFTRSHRTGLSARDGDNNRYRSKCMPTLNNSVTAIMGESPFIPPRLLEVQ